MNTRNVQHQFVSHRFKSAEIVAGKGGLVALYQHASIFISQYVKNVTYFIDVNRILDIFSNIYGPPEISAHPVNLIQLCCNKNILTSVDSCRLAK